MALPQPKQSFPYCGIRTFLPAFILCAIISLQSCKHSKKVYKSDCDDGISFKQISFGKLMDSISEYDQQYVEVTGKYVEDKELSALFGDSLFVDQSKKNGLWVNFSQDCPLYLSGTHQGLFEYNDGQFTQINNKLITIRGKIDLNNKGSHNRYKATIDRVSLVKL
ncbi:MAG TPA: hypothetical protein VFE54_12625 [Mucilaginibacter sp.]|jgi:hypothetical protein|nr:hypothetical protein [Mucilaginibacter sp.]